MIRRACVIVTAVLAARHPAGAQPATLMDVRVPMRDGVELSADVWLPDSSGRFPVVLLRTPYGKSRALFERYRLGRYVRGGYAIVLQDTRGRGKSGGTFDFYFPEGNDGYDTIAWVARQPWSNGRVAMDGGSYLGTVQWLAARARPPSLACIIPTAASGRLFDELPYVGGALHLGWALPWIAGMYPDPPDLSSIDWRLVARHRPLLTLDEAALGRRLPFYRSVLEHPTLDEYWRRIHFVPADFAVIDIPTLIVTGWYDGDQQGALFYWEGIQTHSPVAERHHLIIGPWTHAQTYLGGQVGLGELRFSPASMIDIQAIRLLFLDRCLKRSETDFRSPRALVYLTGSNAWREFDAYPPKGLEYRPLYLHSGGRANTLDGDGRLRWTAPGEQPPDRFTYDPLNPVPTAVAAHDHRALERRDDVLVYTSDVLAAPVDIVGPVRVELFAASDAPDTDFTAKLLDVFPDGRAVHLSPEPGIIRARYRKGAERTELLTPGRPEQLTIRLYDVGHTFLPGHRIRVEISSSAFPYVNPNQNTGNPVATDTAWARARQTIYHTNSRPSHIVLPVLPPR